MTAEERLAYFQGEKRREAAYQIKKQEKNTSFIFLKIKFFIAIMVFIGFLSLDYTGYKIKGIGSMEIIQLVTSDIEFPNEIYFPKRP